MLNPKHPLTIGTREVGHPLLWAVLNAFQDMGVNIAEHKNISWQAHFGGAITGYALASLRLSLFA